MDHGLFVSAWREGRIRVYVDRSAAAKFISARMLLPLFLLPLFGLAVALALLGYVLGGVLVFLGTLALRALVRRSGHGFVLTRCLQDAGFYEQAMAARLLRTEPAEQDAAN
jgi:hypothetical protein